MRHACLKGERIVITIDDFPHQHGPSTAAPANASEIVTALECAFARRPDARPLLFVNSDSLSEIPFLLTRLSRLGVLGNHTASHCDIGSVSLDVWRDDVERCQRAIEPVTSDEPRFFRFPYLRTGADIETKIAARRFLSAQDLITVPGCCPTADWLLGPYYELAYATGNVTLSRKLESTAIAHALNALRNGIIERARSPVRSAPLVLVLHVNRLLAATIEEVLNVVHDSGGILTDASAELLCFEELCRFDEFVGNRGGSFFLRCSSDGRAQLNFGRDWLSIKCLQFRAEFGNLDRRYGYWASSAEV